ncbi:MAG: alpha/beta hydrolase [Alphaproteobacteria bacterium]|nr:alpha/beta hydrolase [Alphaproteobacteria bacterium]MDD9919175.1 alpha/beta hydrolase [Alphaproteobacteria bacterium]
MSTYIHTPSANPSAPTVILLPGVNCGAWFFEDSLAYLLPHFNVLRINNPGVDGAPLKEIYSVKDLARKTLDIMDELGLEEGYVIGHSMGGFHAQHLALLAPKRVKYLVLISTGYGQPHTAKDLLVLAKHAGKTWQKFNRDVMTDPETALKVVFGTNFVENHYSAYQKFIQLRTEHYPGKTASALHLAMGGSFSSWGKLYQVTTPTLVIHGEDDSLITLEHGEAMAKQLRHAFLWKQEGVGHFPTLEEPTTYTRIVDFLLGNPVGQPVKPAAPHNLQESWTWMAEKVKGFFHG